MNPQKLFVAVRVGVLACVSAAILGCPTSTNQTPKIAVAPSVLSFGSAGVEESFTIFNAGGGTLEWTVAEDAGWLTCDVTSGTANRETDRVTLTVDRGSLGTGDYQTSVTITSNGGSKSVGVSMRVPGESQLQVSPSTLNFLGEQISNDLELTNTGTEPLGWTLEVLNPSAPTSTMPVPEYLVFSATSGSVAPAQSETLNVTLDREALPDDAPSTLTLRITSNGGTQLVTVNISSANAGVLSVDPEVLDFGTKQNQLTFNVWNDGATGSEVEFTVTTDRPEFIFLTPTSGSSTGTNELVKDIVSVGVTIDRAKLVGSEDSGHIYVNAAGAEPIEILVTAKAAPIVFEGATNRARAPFIVRFAFTLRDSTGQSINSNDAAVLAELQNAFTIYEDGEALDTDETNLFVQNGLNLKYNVMLLLDYTGSMYNAGEGGGVAIAQMEAAAKQFLNDLPPSYRAGVMEYHERQQANRLIHGFSTSRESLTQSIDDFEVPVADHGASEILDAIVDACARLEDEDRDVLSFDDADVRSLVFISDGRDTSSVNNLEQVVKIAQDARVRLYPIGFGRDIDSSVLVKLATETGGHYYTAPTVDDLTKLLSDEEPSDGTPAPGTVLKDMSRQVVLTYITLHQEGAHTYMIRADYRGQQGYIDRDGVYITGGDVRAGQVALTTAGIENDNTATVYVRADYVPRNVTQFRFRVISSRAYTVEKVADGLLADWVLVDEGGGAYTILTTEDNPLRYGAFGNLVKLKFTGILDESFTFGFRVDNRIYVNPPFTKFFQYPAGTLVSRLFSTTSSVAPIMLSQGFDPDADGAWDYDGDLTVDFDDLYPDDPDLQ